MLVVMKNKVWIKKKHFNHLKTRNLSDFVYGGLKSIVFKFYFFLEKEAKRGVHLLFSISDRKMITPKCSEKST